jgi:regulator of sigma E protease
MQVTPEGPEIASVFPNGTAAAAGFKVGDILLEAGGKPFSQEALQEYLQQAKEGDQVSFKVKRGGAAVDLTGKAAPMPEGAPPPPAPPEG